MKKVYVLAGAVIATFGALSVGSAAFASGGCDQSWGCDSIPDTVPVTSETTTTTMATTTEAPTTAAPTTAAPTTAASTTTTEAGGAAVTVSTDQVGQEAPTTTVRRPGSDGLLPNTGSDIAIPLVLAGLAAGTGAATLLVRRRANVS